MFASAVYREVNGHKNFGPVPGGDSPREVMQFSRPLPHTAWDLATSEGLLVLVFLAAQQLPAMPWCLYEVRRTFAGPSRAMRSVQIRATGSGAAMQAALPDSAEADEHGIRRVWLRPPTGRYPRVEHLLVAAPAGVKPKQRKSFEAVWRALAADDGVACDPGPDAYVLAGRAPPALARRQHGAVVRLRHHPAPIPHLAAREHGVGLGFRGVQPAAEDRRLGHRAERV